MAVGTATMHFLSTFFKSLLPDDAFLHPLFGAALSHGIDSYFEDS